MVKSMVLELVTPLCKKLYGYAKLNSYIRRVHTNTNSFHYKSSSLKSTILSNSVHATVVL